jgi:hypothetical protein
MDKPRKNQIAFAETICEGFQLTSRANNRFELGYEDEVIIPKPNLTFSTPTKLHIKPITRPKPAPGVARTNAGWGDLIFKTNGSGYNLESSSGNASPLGSSSGSNLSPEAYRAPGFGTRSNLFIPDIEEQVRLSLCVKPIERTQYIKFFDKSQRNFL